MQLGKLPTHSQHTWKIDIFFLIICLGSLFFALLGTRPLFIPEEGRYAEVAREMFVSGDYITPYLNGIKYFEKPILYYWLEVAALKIGGINLWSLRSINALIGLYGCILTYCTARLLYDRITGVFAAIILATSMLYFVMVHMISMDLPITVFIASSLYFFLLGSQSTRSRLIYYSIASVMAALSVLTKGLIGIVLPSIIVGIWMLFVNKWRILNFRFLIPSILIFLFIVIPWHLLAELHNPGFLNFYIIEQHFLRYTTPEVGHSRPLWFFLPAIIFGFFPWIIFLPATLASSIPPSWKLRLVYKTELFFLIWILVIFVFFTFSKSKLIPYILPIFPALAILTARFLTRKIVSSTPLKTYYACLVIFATILSIGLMLFTHYFPVFDIVYATVFLCITAIILLGGTFLSFVYSEKNSFAAIKITMFTTYLFLLSSITAIPFVDTRPTLPFATILKPILTNADDIIAFNQYYHDLPFYLGRCISILNWKNELSFGSEQQIKHWIINDKTFWQRWDSKKRVFVVMSREEFEKSKMRFPDKKFYVLGKTVTNILVANKTISSGKSSHLRES